MSTSGHLNMFVLNVYIHTYIPGVGARTTRLIAAVELSSTHVQIPESDRRVLYTVRMLS